jgi:hypothetical protein
MYVGLGWNEWKETRNPHSALSSQQLSGRRTQDKTQFFLKKSKLFASRLEDTPILSSRVKCLKQQVARK